MTALPNTQIAPRPSDALPASALLDLLRQMLLIRRFEERTMQSYTQQKVGGFCHIYIGQEATAVGSIAALRPDDPLITAYRDHGHALARGMEPQAAMAEMFGRAAGCCKGKGGSMHLFDKAHHMYGGHAIVGGQTPLAIGLAFAVQYLHQDRLVACFFGDGALNQGTLHESMNLAAIWKLPILFVCENNAYSMGTSISRHTSVPDDLSVKAAAYGIRTAVCDGMDALATYDCFKTLADALRPGPDKPAPGPAFIDCQTYRYKGHSMSDPQKYRTKEEVAGQEEQDPIKRLVEALARRGVATPDAVAQIDAQCKQTALDAVRFAESAPPVPVTELYTDVYANPYGPPYAAEPGKPGLESAQPSGTDVPAENPASEPPGD
jgi:pyruvate dehydrogenase E1 component alpha subunit